MRKITLDLDRLSVDSFATTPQVEKLRGTVDAAALLATRDTCRTSCSYGGDPMCTCPPPP